MTNNQPNYENCGNSNCCDNDRDGHCMYPKEAEYSCGIHVPSPLVLGFDSEEQKQAYHRMIDKAGAISKTSQPRLGGQGSHEAAVRSISKMPWNNI